MIVVDSNTWADYFNGAPTPHTLRLDAALIDEEDVAVLPIIVTEVLQGFRTEKGFLRARRVLAALPLIERSVFSNTATNVRPMIFRFCSGSVTPFRRRRKSREASTTRRSM